ncbi:MAG: hypothetical protein WCA98_19225 [Candidatus Acidiferrales bacterium]
MSNLDLRPLSLGEILDRTFTLYRGYFVLFMAISVVPRILVLILNLAQLLVIFPGGFRLPTTQRTPGAVVPPVFATAGGIATYLGFIFVIAIVAMAAVLISQGATVIAVSELYLGRTISISESFRRVFRDFWTLAGVVTLNFLAVMAGFLLLIVPGIYVLCRLALSVPAALLENLPPRNSLERSWALTGGYAGRVFLILLLYFALSAAAGALFAVPFEILMFASAKNPHMMLISMILMQVGSFVGTVLVTPVLTIASAILYYDLRVRKEAFDLQLMMNPLSGAPQLSGGLPTMLS